MNISPIGIFDSGIGGLTVAHAISQKLPNEQLIYFGDLAHLPYGDKSAANIQQYSLQITDFLLAQGCKMIVIACNTASAVALDLLRQHIGKRAILVNVIDPVVEKVVHSEVNKVGVIATKRTTQTQIYPKKLKQLQANLKITAQSTHSLVAIIEEGLFRDENITQALIHHYFSKPDFKDIDGLVLGCTHYPIIKDQLNAYFRQQVTIFDSTICTADYVWQILTAKNWLNPKRVDPHQFFVSDYTPAFEATAELFFGKPVQLSKIRLADV